MKRKPAKYFQDLIVWQKAHQFVLSSYHLKCRYYLILAKDLGFGDTLRLMPHLEEVSKLLEAYTSAILAPDF